MSSTDPRREIPRTDALLADPEISTYAVRLTPARVRRVVASVTATARAGDLAAGEVRAVIDEGEPVDLYKYRNPYAPAPNRFDKGYKPPPSPEQVSQGGGYVMYGLYSLIGVAAKGLVLDDLHLNVFLDLVQIVEAKFADRRVVGACGHCIAQRLVFFVAPE